MCARPSAFVDWTRALVDRHQAELRFAEVRRGLQALSAQYVARRLDAGSAPLEGRGKRAAFALYYAPMHYAVVAGVCAEAGLRPPHTVHDWGCGTGVGGAAWAHAAPGPASQALVGVDASAWALGEARWNWGALGLSGRTSRGDMAKLAPPSAPRAPGGIGIVLAFAVNELADAARARLLAALQTAASRGCALLIVEPIARGITPWWQAFAEALAPFGATAREHRLAAELPEAVAAYGRAAGLDHRVLTARSLIIDPSQAGPSQAGPSQTGGPQKGAPLGF